MTYLFVYGTLMRGYHNNALLRGSKYLGPAETCFRYEMISLGGFPAVVQPLPGPPSGSEIIGELYEVNPSTLARVDQLEGHPDFYCRESVPVRYFDMLDGDSPHTTRAWIYIVKHDRYSARRVVPNGDWRNYRPNMLQEID